MLNYMIFDLQFGSTGKGLFAQYLAKHRKPHYVMSAFGPNAGHTAHLPEGTFVSTMVPIGITSPQCEAVFIGPGSVINYESLINEVAQLREWEYNAPLFIHQNAAVICWQDRINEESLISIGSTMKGTAEANIRKMRRTARWSIPRTIDEQYWEHSDLNSDLDINIMSPEEWVDLLIDDHTKCIQIEGAQGFSLSIHHGFYPYVTSRDVTPAQVLADVGYPMALGWPLVHGTARTYPIRVANRYDDNGHEIGNSGPCYPDQQETTWEKIGVEPELTTVTKLPRRVFTWSHQQIVQATAMSGAKKVFLNFCNYTGPTNIDKIRESIDACGAKLQWTGWGPKITDISEDGWE